MIFAIPVPQIQEQICLFSMVTPTMDAMQTGHGETAVHKRICFFGDEERHVALATARVDVPTVSHPPRLHDERICCTFDPSISPQDSRETGSFLLCECDATQLCRSTNVTVWDPGPCPSRYVSRVFTVFSASLFESSRLSS